MPGIILAWKYCLRRNLSDELDDDFPISTYDDIVATVEEFDEHMALEDDNAPSKYERLIDFNPGAEPDEDGGLGNELAIFNSTPKIWPTPKNPNINRHLF